MSTLSRHEEACNSRVRAAELSPNDYSLVVSAATALRMLDRKSEAEKWYRQVMKTDRKIRDELKILTNCPFFFLGRQT